MLTQPVSYWQAKVQLAVSKDTELENYLIEKNKIEVNADRLFIQALYLNAFWNKYKTNPKMAPSAVFQEALNNMDTYKLAPGMNEVLFDAICEKNKKLKEQLAEEKEEQEREEQEQKKHAEKEKERKEKELKEKEEQRRKGQERKENERKVKEEQKRKEQERKEKERKEKEEQEHKDKEQNEKARKEKEQKEQKEKREQKIKEEAERHKRVEERKLKEQEAKKNREEELKPLKEARRSLQVDDQWKIESFLNYINAYENTPQKQKDFINGDGEQIKFLRKILSFMEKHATELEDTTLREILEKIAARYNGRLKDANEDKDQIYTFVFEKEITKSEVVSKPAQQPVNKEPALNKSHINLEVIALMQACISFGKDNLNPKNLSTMFFLSACAYSGGFFLHKVLNDSVAPVPQSFCYSASTVGAFTPFVKDFYKLYQNHLAKNHFENAKKALLATSTWDIELFTNVIDKLLKSKINAFDNLKEEDDKIVFLRKVLKIYLTVQHHAKVLYVKDQGLGILAALEFIYGDLEKASKHDLLLGQNVSSSKTISEKGKRLNNFLMLPDNKLHGADELKKAQDFIAKMKQGMRIDIIYMEIYEYAEKKKPESVLVLTKQ